MITTKRLLKELVDGKELIHEIDDSGILEPIYAKLGKYGDMIFKHNKCLYSLDQFSNLFPQYYAFTRITTRDWKVVPEVKVKPKEWYEDYPATLESEGIYKYDKYVICNIVSLHSDICYDVIITGYCNYRSGEDGLITSTGDTIRIKDNRILPISSVNLVPLIYNFNF